MEILPEESIEFLEQEEFRARTIIAVGKEITFPKGGAKHVKGRAIVKGNAYCYEEIKVKSI